MSDSKQQVNFRASEHTRQQLDELCSLMGETQTGVVSIAIDRLWMQLVKASDNRDRVGGESNTQIDWKGKG